MKPTRKVSAALLAGALTTILIGVVNRLTDITVTGEEGSAVAVLLSFVVSWIIPDRMEE
jgi:hypothetical protein